MDETTMIRLYGFYHTVTFKFYIERVHNMAPKTEKRITFVM